MQNTNHLFVYGSLRSDAPHSMHRLLGRSRLLGRAWTQGRLYLVEGFPALVLSDHPDDIVVGELYALHHEAARAILDALDGYEGITEESARPVYRREVIKVTAEYGDVAAWAYLLNIEENHHEHIVSGDYVRWSSA